MKLTLVCLALLLAACENLDPIPTAEMAFEYWHGEVSDKCDQYIHDTAIHYVDQVTLQTSCDVPTTAIDGCSYAVSNKIFAIRGLSGGDNADVLAHEYLHILLQCENDNGDANHIDPSWSLLERTR
jgi:hypothetical protein